MAADKSDKSPALPFPKQAIVVVHGMGEQRPMDTIKSFVDAVWRTDGTVTQNGLPEPTAVWSKPDERAGSLELRRITTRESTPSPGLYERGVRSDFYELYWADLTASSPWQDFVAWLRNLLFRNPFTQVPRRVLLAWILLWAIALLFTVFTIWFAIPAGTELFGWTVPSAGWGRWLIPPALAALTTFVHSYVQMTFGRVVRYTRATPGNIAARKQVRERGLALLETLHTDKEYQRVILVGHSLGSILAYELLAFFWARHAAGRRVKQGTPAFDALAGLERAARHLEENPSDTASIAEWEKSQRLLRRELAARPAPGRGVKDAVDTRWILSDLVTLGSPLTHAEFLIASSRADLDERQRARELPTAPPVREPLDPDNLEEAREAGMLPAAIQPAEARLFSYPRRDGEGTWEMHHAAPFAVVRWTNIHDPARFLGCGDMISGPLSPLFGPAVRDVDLRGKRGQAWRFTHTRYWATKANDAPLQALREAVNLLDQPV